ncbi:MAG: sigma-70 family RNA polymerase sigma factor [Planctomycetota bacterium]
MSLPIKSELASADEALNINVPDDRDPWKTGSRSIDSSMSPPEVSQYESAESLADFFEKIAPQAKRFAMSMTHRWCDAEELVQESFFRMTRTEQQATEDSQTSVVRSRKSYLFTTIRNLAIDRSRSSSIRRTEHRELDALVDHRANENRGQQLQTMEATIGDSLAGMPETWADALKLKVNGELTYAEIANVLNATTDQIRGWIYRARKVIANDLRQKGLIGNEE